MTRDPGARLRIGVVGAGRSRNGLGPFLAQHFEAAGAQVVAVAGRTAERGRANAAALAATLGHDVAAADDLEGVFAHELDALVVASPAEQHLVALEAALQNRVACLCEKPLVTPAQLAEGRSALAGFAARGVLLAENTQWPHVLPAVTALHGPAPAPARRLAMGLSPTGVGAVAMLEDAVPHLLSVAQALLPPAAQRTAVLAAVEVAPRDPAATACALRLRLVHDDGELQAELHLRRQLEQPRPAWLAVDDRRIDRRIGPGYSIAFAADDREVSVEDPLRQLVRAFCAGLAAPAAARASAAAVAAPALAWRLARYGEILAAAGG
ncbi:MAG: Gfo/Idh/MocA family oxidoreductase [Planctomycetota bacterium]